MKARRTLPAALIQDQLVAVMKRRRETLLHFQGSRLKRLRPLIEPTNDTMRSLGLKRPISSRRPEPSGRSDLHVSQKRAESRGLIPPSISLQLEVSLKKSIKQTANGIKAIII